MMTFEYLSQLCQNKEQVFSQPGGPKDPGGGETLSRTYTHKHTHILQFRIELVPVLWLCAAEAVVSEDGIHMVPFQFDLIQLLPKCQQVELFFLTFSTGITHEVSREQEPMQEVQLENDCCVFQQCSWRSKLPVLPVCPVSSCSTSSTTAWSRSSTTERSRSPLATTPPSCITSLSASVTAMLPHSLCL